MALKPKVPRYLGWAKIDHFDIIHRKGKKIFVAYALSRNDEDVEAMFCVIFIIQPDWINEAREEWKNYKEVWALIWKLQQDPSTSDTFS